MRIDRVKERIPYQAVCSPSARRGITCRCSSIAIDNVTTGIALQRIINIELRVVEHVEGIYPELQRSLT